MSEKVIAGSSGGIGCLGLIAIILGCAFVIMKLCSVITWSWWWVTAPFWIYAALCAMIYLIIIMVMLITFAGAILLSIFASKG